MFNAGIPSSFSVYVRRFFLVGCFAIPFVNCSMDFLAGAPFLDGVDFDLGFDTPELDDLLPDLLPTGLPPRLLLFLPGLLGPALPPEGLEGAMLLFCDIWTECCC